MKISNIHRSDVSYALDDIYHSESTHEMQVKADLHNIDLTDCNVLIFLIDTTTYHHAFWPHTAKRFTAFKKLLKTLKDIPSDEHFKDIVEHVDGKLYEYADNKWLNSTPGRIQEIKNLKQVLKILERLEEDYARQRRQRHQNA